jgi:hypothetical protein
LTLFDKKSKKMSSSNQKSIESEMISIKHRYLEIQEQLRMAEKVNSNLGKEGATNNQNLLIYTPHLNTQGVGEEIQPNECLQKHEANAGQKE